MKDFCASHPLKALQDKHLERGQATLPNLHLSAFERFQCGLRVDCSLRRTYSRYLECYVR